MECTAVHGWAAFCALQQMVAEAAEIAIVDLPDEHTSPSDRGLRRRRAEQSSDKARAARLSVHTYFPIRLLLRPTCRKARLTAVHKQYCPQFMTLTTMLFHRIQ
jgi:hypothetical protein